jgi:hypothetical protein
MFYFPASPLDNYYIKNVSTFLKMLQHFLFNISNRFFQYFVKCATFFRNVGKTFFSIIFSLLPTFFRNVTTFLKNVGFLNYFLSTFCNMLQPFVKCWKNIFLHLQPPAGGAQACRGGDGVSVYSVTRGRSVRQRVRRLTAGRQARTGVAAVG